jgi:hypothetical protein
LLIAVAPNALGAVKALFQDAGLAERCHAIGKISGVGGTIKVI